MSKQQALFQALAASNALLMIFIAVCHEVVGARLFPYGPALFGGPLGWHATGIFGMALGSLIFAGALGLIRFPVVRWALVLAGIGLVVTPASAGLSASVLLHIKGTYQSALQFCRSEQPSFCLWNGFHDKLKQAFFG